MENSENNIVELAGNVILNEEGKVLLLCKKDKKHLEFPGGKVEGWDDGYKNAAIREAIEEIGVGVSIIMEIGVYTFDVKKEIDGVLKLITYKAHMYQSNIVIGEPRVNEEDVFSELLWLDIDPEIKELGENARMLFRDILDGKVFLI